MQGLTEFRKFLKDKGITRVRCYNDKRKGGRRFKAEFPWSAISLEKALSIGDELYSKGYMDVEVDFGRIVFVSMDDKLLPRQGYYKYNTVEKGTCDWKQHRREMI